MSQIQLIQNSRMGTVPQMISGVRTKGEPAKEKADSKDKSEKDDASAS